MPDLSIPSLDKPCSHCQGTGRINNPEWIKWSRKVRESFETIQNNDDVTKVMEWFVQNNPKPDTSHELVCDKCGGMGIVPTEAGWAILKFIKMFQK
ncbi:MAG: hypothetical protein ACOY46_07765 [Bacillota bacterium]